MIKIPFPTGYIRAFKPTLKEKNKDPFIKFYEYILRHYKLLGELYGDLEPLLKRLQVSAVALCKEDEKKLEFVYMLWGLKNSIYSKKYIKSSYNMENLQYGPVSITKEYIPLWISEEVEEGFIYINEKELFKGRDNE